MTGPIPFTFYDTIYTNDLWAVDEFSGSLYSVPHNAMAMLRITGRFNTVPVYNHQVKLMEDVGRVYEHKEESPY
jgi:hypothetical protein